MLDLWIVHSEDYQAVFTGGIGSQRKLHTLNFCYFTVVNVCSFSVPTTRVIEEPMSGGVLLDLTLANKNELAEDVKAGDNLGCDNPEMMDFRMLRRQQA
ncbi:hypothetical protein llap_383 [Limosa lapponica baueri]|uniref:Uncharacterized protein n=1 Tax=Limosa lapponica baueri TaxID=1758121 RepID=A0A2I0UTF6_LIMLA|nr:hypothetical protein llap_383 [Limosa lapponica baueri]